MARPNESLRPPMSLAGGPGRPASDLAVAWTADDPAGTDDGALVGTARQPWQNATSKSLSDLAGPGRDSQKELGGRIWTPGTRNWQATLPGPCQEPGRPTTGGDLAKTKLSVDG